MLLQTSDVIAYVENHIGDFHARRLQNLQSLKLRSILKRKNPYLFRAKNILSGAELVKILLDAHLSSQEESIFGEFLEGLAIFVCGKVYNGRKSAAQGIDLEFEKDSTLYLVSIKSGPNWGNSRQISKMKDDFKKAKRILSTSGGIREAVAINGCCYGRDNNPNKGDYFKLCGQAFWEFISGAPDFYTEIIEPLGHQAKHRNEEFNQAYARIINRFTAEFGEEFYTPSNEIDWEKLVKFNSSSRPIHDG
jgi:hypothetical protein